MRMKDTLMSDSRRWVHPCSVTLHYCYDYPKTLIGQQHPCCPHAPESNTQKQQLTLSTLMLDNTNAGMCSSSPSTPTVPQEYPKTLIGQQRPCAPYAPERYTQQ